MIDPLTWVSGRPNTKDPVKMKVTWGSIRLVSVLPKEKNSVVKNDCTGPKGVTIVNRPCGVLRT